MSRPEVSLENYEAMYDYYDNREISAPIANAAHNLFGTVIRPHMERNDSAVPILGEHFERDGQIILAANHLSLVDALVMASVVKRDPILNPVIGNVVIPAKAPLYYKYPWKLARPVYDNFIAFPTFREKDVRDDEETRQLRRQASERLVDLLIRRADSGINIAIFPTGERDKSETEDKAIAVRSGIGRIATQILRPENFLVVPIGIRYEKGIRGHIMPRTYMGVPFALADTQDQVSADVSAALTKCVERTY